MTGIQHQEAKTDYIDLTSILKSIIEKKWLVIFTSLIVFVFAITYTLLRPTKYQTTLLLQKQYSSLGAFSKSNQQQDTKVVPEDSSAVQIALMRSRFILGPVIRELGLDIKVVPSKYTYFNRLFFHHKNNVHISVLQLPSHYQKRSLRLTIDAPNHYQLYDGHQKLLLEGQLGQLVTNNDVSIQVDKLNASVGANFIVTKQSEAAVVQELLSRLHIIDLSYSSENTANKVAIFQLSLTGTDPVLITKTLNQIARVTQQKSIERKSLQAERTLDFLNQQLPVIKQSLQEAEIRLNQYRSTTGEIDIKLQTHYLMGRLTSIDRQLQELRLKRANLLQQYTEQYPFVRSINEKIIELKKQRTGFYDELKKLPAADQLATTINRDISVKNNLYITILNQIHELGVIKAGIVSDIQILLPATIPDIYMPIRISIVGVASLFIGFMLGCFIALLWKMLSRHITLLTATSMPVTKMIPE